MDLTLCEPGVYIWTVSKKGIAHPRQPSKMGTNQNNFPDRSGDSHDLESLLDLKAFRTWL